MSTAKKPLVLVIMDGWGYSTKQEFNAVAAAKTPNLDRLAREVVLELGGGDGDAVDEEHDVDIVERYATRVAAWIAGRIAAARNVHAIIKHWADAAPDAEAMVHDGKRTSYAQLNSRVDALARAQGLIAPRRDSR